MRFSNLLFCILKINVDLVWKRRSVHIMFQVEHSPCKRGFPGSSSDCLTAHFSQHVTFGAQRGVMHASLVSLRSENLPLKIEDKFQIFEGVCHDSDLVTIGEIIYIYS